VAALILIGDSCEEPLTTIEGPAVELGEAGIPVYGFFEGTNADGRAAFELITSATRGALIPFDANSPNQLSELLGAVAAYIVGGVAALADQRPEIVALLTAN
jgi:hypothetical protein